MSDTPDRATALGSAGRSPVTCQELVELVTAYVENALVPGDRARFEAHARACPGCQAYIEQMRQTIELTGRLREEDIAPAASARLLQAFRDWKRGV